MSAAQTASGQASTPPPPFIDVNGDNQLVGATFVNVNGVFYDVAFMDDTCVALFDGCDDPFADFAFQSRAEASAAAQALLDQVFLDDIFLASPEGLFDTRPELTYGIESAIGGNIIIPYELIDSGTLVRSLAAFNGVSDADDGVITPADALIVINTLDDAGSAYAVFTRTPRSVPEPSALWLMSLAMLGWVAALQRGAAHRRWPRSRSDIR